MSVNDTFFGYIYTFFGSYFHPSGYFAFSTFPKFFLTLACYFLYDDRLTEILGYVALTSLIHAFNGFAFEDYMLACHFENINEFNTIDFYILMYLDLPVLFLKGCHNFKEHAKERYDSLFKAKVYNDIPTDADKALLNDSKEK